MIGLADRGGVLFGFDDQCIKVGALGWMEDLPEFCEDGFHLANDIGHGGSGFAHKVALLEGVQGDWLKGAVEEVWEIFSLGIPLGGLFPVPGWGEVDENRRTFLKSANLSQAGTQKPGGFMSSHSVIIEGGEQIENEDW